MPACNKGDSKLKDAVEPVDLRVLLSGPSLGQYCEHPIPAWVTNKQGVVWDFERTVDPARMGLRDLADDEIVVLPGLVYRRRVGRVAVPNSCEHAL